MQVFIDQYVGSMVSNSRLVEFKSFGRLRATKGVRERKKAKCGRGFANFIVCNKGGFTENSATKFS